MTVKCDHGDADLGRDFRRWRAYNNVLGISFSGDIRMSTHRRWEDLPAEVRADLNAGRQRNRVAAKAKNAAKRELPKAARASNRSHTREYRAPLELRSVSRVDTKTHARLEACRELQYVEELVEGRTPSRKPSLRETMSEAISREYERLRITLRQAAEANPARAQAIEAELQAAEDCCRKLTRPPHVPPLSPVDVISHQPHVDRMSNTTAADLKRYL